MPDLSKLYIRVFTREVDCAICNKEWVATYPDGVPGLECPRCGYMNPSPETR